MIGIICPSEDEMNPIIEHMVVKDSYTTAMLKINRGTIKNKEVVLLFSGVCKVNAAIATQLVINKFQIDKIILSGVAGSINESIKIFDTIIATEIAHHDVANEILTEYHPWMESIWFKQKEEYIENLKIIDNDSKFGLKYGRIISGESFIISNKDKLDLNRKYQAMCVDMESASVAQVCYANGIPLLVIRTITDNCDGNGFDNFECNIVQSSIISGKIAIEYIKRFG
jgi:adenosylhomocysteine nucleosidase